MTFELPDLTLVLVAFLAVAVVAAAIATGTLATFFARNRAVRVRRREGVFQYYGNLVAGH